MSANRQVRTPKIAEGLVEHACQVAGAVVNHAHDDQFGWDLIVQLEGVSKGGPVDLDPAGLTALVQVKSTTTGRRSCRLKLSNALRFAKEGSPCFLVLLTFEKGAAQPHEVYLRHIWRDEITGALKAARIAHNAKRDDLHKVSHILAFTEADRCTLADIPHQIEKAVDAVGRGYSAQKAQMVDSAGYEDGYGQGSFTLADDVDPNTFIDLMLGRVADIPIKAFELREMRFGLPGPEVVPMTSGRLSVMAEPKEGCHVVVGPTDGGEEMTLSGELFIPGIPNLPEDLFRFRIQTPVMEVIIWPSGRSTVNAKFDADQRLDISTMGQLANLWTWMEAGSLSLGLWARGLSLGQGSIAIASKPTDRRWARLRAALTLLLNFMPANRWPAEARFTLRDMFAGLSNLELMAGQVSTSGVQMTLGNIAPNFETLMRGCSRHIAPTFLDFGEATLFAVVETPIERFDVGENDASVVLGAPTILKRAVLPGDVRSNLQYMQVQLDAALEARGGLGVMHGALSTAEELGTPEA